MLFILEGFLGTFLEIAAITMSAHIQTVNHFSINKLLKVSVFRVNTYKCRSKVYPS